MDGNSISIRNTLDGKKYSIPEYQRPFSWTESQVTELFEDIERFYEEHKHAVTTRHLDTSYYLGSIVIIGQEGSELSIVDGQQRLTTIICMLRSLYYFLWRYKKRGFIESQNEITDLVKNLITRIEGLERRLPIVLSNEDVQVFFQGSIISGIEDGSFVAIKEFWSSDTGKLAKLRKKNPASRIKDAIKLSRLLILRTLRKEKSRDSRVKKLQGLTSALLEHFTVFQLSMKNEDQAYEYFEGLNDRGLALGTSDLIKNRCLSDANRKNHKAREKVKTDWDEVQNVFTDNNKITFGLDDFLHYSWLGHEGPAIKKTTLFKQFKKAEKDPEQYVDNITTDVLHLNEIFNETGADDTGKRLKDICFNMTVKMAFVALLQGRSKFLGSKPKDWEILVQTVHAFCVRWKVIEAGQPVITNCMHKTALMIRDGKSVASIRAFLLTQVSDNHFKESLIKYSKTSSAFAYLLVYWIENEMHGKTSGVAPMQHGLNQLEHIMPQRPKKTAWPHATKLKENDPDEFTNALWSLGNMAPLPQPTNGSLGNKDIKTKSAEYNKTSLKSYNNENFSKFKNNNKWTIQSIERRTEHLVNNFACKAFNLS